MKVCRGTVYASIDRVTDSQNWQPPTGNGSAGDDRSHNGTAGGGSGDDRARGGRPAYGEYSQTGGFPPPGQPSTDYPPRGGTQPGWAPPPKPGLIPLRPLSFGALLGTPFLVLRRNPKAAFGSALLIQAAITLVSLLIVGLVAYFAFTRVLSAPPEDQDALEAGATISVILSALIPMALSLVASSLLQGIIVLEVARGTLGEKLGMWALWRAAGRRLLPLVLWTLLLFAGIVVSIAVVGGLTAVFAILGGAWIGLAVAIGVIGGLGLIVLWVWLYTKTSLVPSLIVLERLGIRSSIRRSWRLTNGYFWRTFGVQALVAVIVNVMAQVVTTPLSLLFGVAVSLVDPNAAIDAYIPSIVLYVLILFVALVLGAVTAVIQSATTALIYIDLRMRKEGLDLELARFVESAQHPGASLPDPYRAPARA